MSPELHGTSVPVPGLQANTPYYVRLQVRFPDNTFALADTTFTSGTGLAHLTNPTDGATDVDPSTPLAWNSVLDAEMYSVSLSTSQPGSTDVYASGDLPNITSLTQSKLQPNTLFYPNSNGLIPPSLKPKTKYYARVVTQKGGVRFNVDSSFTTGYGIAHLTSQSNWDGAGDVGQSPVFEWNSVPDADAGWPYSLTVGTLPGRDDVLSTGPTGSTSATARLQPGTTYYVRLSTQKHGVWQHVDSAFSTGYWGGASFSGSRILYPPDNATDVDPFAPIVWSSLPGSPIYNLYVGDGKDRELNDRNAAQFRGNASQTSWAGGLIGGKTYHVKLWTTSFGPRNGCSTQKPCNYLHAITFTTAPVALPHNASSFYQNVAAATAAVRSMAAGLLNIPRNSTFLKNNLYPEDFGVAFCADFANNLLVQLQNQGIAARRRNMVFGAGPASHTAVEYYDPMQGKWAATDPTFGMIFYDPSKSPPTMSIDDVAQALEQGSAGSIPYQFVTVSSTDPDCPECYGNFWAANYPTDPALDYLNPSDMQTQIAPSYNPTKFLTASSSSVGVKGSYTFQFANAADSVVVQDSGSQIVVRPQPPPSKVDHFGNFSTSLILQDGWSFATTPPAGMQIQRTACPVFSGPYCP